MKTISILLTAALLAIAGCGEDEETAATSAQPTTDAAMQEKQADDAAMKKMEADEAAMKKDDEDAAMMKQGDEIKIAVGESEFGEMLFDSKKQAIYIFEKDPKGESACYDDCAKAWPPVFTDGQPVAGDGVEKSLLGTTKRRDGRLQVTYDDQPLYYYAHEKPAEVRCHNVNLNGGLWWVVGPDGKRRP